MYSLAITMVVDLPYPVLGSLIAEVMEAVVDGMNNVKRYRKKYPQLTLNSLSDPIDPDRLVVEFGPISTPKRFTISTSEKEFESLDRSTLYKMIVLGYSAPSGAQMEDADSDAGLLWIMQFIANVFPKAVKAAVQAHTAQK